MVRLRVLRVERSCFEVNPSRMQPLKTKEKLDAAHVNQSESSGWCSLALRGGGVARWVERVAMASPRKEHNGEQTPSHALAAWNTVSRAAVCRYIAD